MESQKVKFTVGLFVACGIGIAVVAVIWLGIAQVTKGGKRFITFFNESVQGLDIESPVNYRGVPVGQVRTDLAQLRLAMQELTAFFDGTSTTQTNVPATVVDKIRRMK